MIFNKTLSKEDFENMTEPQHIENINALLSGVQKRYEHPMRAWEYGLVLNALRQEGITEVLDVGGGGSIFAPACAWLDIKVTQVDPGDCKDWVVRQAEVIGKELEYIQLDFFDYSPGRKKFEAVVCLSTIEHVLEDERFFKRLLELVKTNGLLCLTTDFHPTGKAQVDGHIRTYNKESMRHLMALGKEANFKPYSNYDYDYFEANVNNYTFASLIMQKQSRKRA